MSITAPSASDGLQVRVLTAATLPQEEDKVGGHFKTVSACNLVGAQAKLRIA